MRILNQAFAFASDGLKGALSRPLEASCTHARRLVRADPLFMVA